MKIRGTISNDLDVDKCYLGHDPEQQSSKNSKLKNESISPGLPYLMKINLIIVNFEKLSR